MSLRVSTRPGAALLAHQLAQQGLHLPDGSRLPACVEALALLEAERVLSRAEARAARGRLAALIEREATPTPPA